MATVQGWLEDPLLEEYVRRESWYQDPDDEYWEGVIWSLLGYLYDTRTGIYDTDWPQRGHYQSDEAHAAACFEHILAVIGPHGRHKGYTESLRLRITLR